MSFMQHRGFKAKIEYSDEDECFIGHIDGVKDIVGFHGESVIELKNAFIEAVDDYINFCSKVGKSPQRIKNESLILRIAADVRGTVENAARISGKNFNQWATEALYKEARLVCA